MAENRIKRNIAYKLRIGDLLIGKPVNDNERFSFLELGNKRIVRVNIIGNIIDKFESEGEKKYIFMTIDDGSGQISVKSFGDDINKVKDLPQGQTVVVIGVLRQFNNEVYISPEIVKELDPRYLLVRKLEIEKERKQNPLPTTQYPNQNKNQIQNNNTNQNNSQSAETQPPQESNSTGQTTEQNNLDSPTSIKDRILGIIKNSEQEGGVYTDQIIMQNKDASPEIINQEIKKLLEEGIIFEPRPGKVRWLG